MVIIFYEDDDRLAAHQDRNLALVVISLCEDCYSFCSGGARYLPGEGTVALMGVSRPWCRLHTCQEAGGAVGVPAGMPACLLLGLAAHQYNNWR